MTTIPHKAKEAMDAETLDAAAPKITFRVSPEFRRKLRVFAAETDSTIEGVCMDALAEFMKAPNKQPRARAS